MRFYRLISCYCFGVFIFYAECVEPRPSVLNMTLPAFAAERRAGACRRYRSIAGTRRRRSQPSIDISCTQGAQQQTSRTLLLSVDGTDR